MSSGTDIPLFTGGFSDDELWMDLYNLLRPRAKVWAYNSGVPTWKGQEYDIAEDIVQTALLKTFQYTRRAREKGEVIASVTKLSFRIARNCFIDMRRRELRLQHFSQDPSTSNEQFSLERLVDPSQEAEEKIYEEWVLAACASFIATFSTKLRLAILADLANLTHVAEESAALQQALLASGIRLRDYQRAPSPDPAERGRQSALRSLAYKRVSQANLR